MNTKVHLFLPLILLFFVFKVESNASPNLLNNIYISDYTVLLPYDSRVSYTLEASNGCFEWYYHFYFYFDFITNNLFRSSSVAGIVDIETDDHICQKRISIRLNKNALNVKGEGASTWLLAKDKISLKTLKCEVLFESIERIELISTTKNLSVADTRKFSVEGYDKEGNKFTSLEGLPFHWEVTSENENNVAQIVSFRDQFIEISEIILKMEEKGYRSSVVLIKAINVGKATITARLSDPIYSKIKEHKINLFVFESLSLLPDKTIYMTPYSTIKFQLRTFKNDVFTKIETPNLSYRWTTSNTAISRVDDTGLVQLKGLGTTTVKVTLVIIEDNYVDCNINVVEPAFLSVHIVDKNHYNETTLTSRTNLISGREYMIDVILYDQHRNPIYHTNDVTFKMNFENEFFKVNSITTNHNHLEVVPLKEGTTELVVSLISIGDPNLGKYRFTKELKYSERITIVSPISITGKRKINLPYDPKVSNTYQLVASGGSGMFQWSHSDESVTKVTNNGIVISNKPGNSIITCYDRILTDNEDKINVTVSLPKRLEILDSIKQVEIGKKFLVGVSMFDKNDVPFDNCSSLSFRWDIPTHDLEQLTGTIGCPENSNMCACIYLKAIKEGQSKLTVSYNYLEDDHIHTISGTTLISTFKPYTISLKQISLTFGSSVEFTISGGPQPWSYSQIPLPSLSPEDDSQVLIEDITLSNQPGLWKYRITCLKYGSQNIIVSIGDKTHQGKGNAFTQYTLPFTCTEPKIVLFVPRVPRPSEKIVKDPEIITNENIPLLCSYFEKFDFNDNLSDEDMKILPTHYKLRNNRLVHGFIKVYNEKGRVFDDFSSLDIDVTSDDPSLLTFISETDSNNTVKEMKLSDREGTAKIKVTIKGFKKEVINKLPKTKKPSFNPIIKEFEVVVANNIRITPPRAVLFNHRKNSVTLKTIGGSGYNHIFLNDKTLARLEFSPGENEITLYPQKTGIAKVVAHDVCLGGSEIETAIVYISEVHSIRLRCRDMIKLGEQTTIIVELVDIHENVFEPSQYKYMDFRLHIDGNSVQVTPHTLAVDDIPKKANQISPSSKYIAVGKSVGMSSISFSVINPISGKTVTSTPLQIHVYTHIKIHPRKVDLIPGASFQLTTIGGPPFRSEVVYSSKESGIIDVQNDGLIVAKNKLGKTEVVVTSIVRGSRNLVQRRDEMIHAGQDSIDVEVKELTDIIIHASTTRIIQGEDIVIRVMGSQMESPFTWGNVDVQFKWDVTNPEILSISSLHNGNVNADEEKGFSVVVKAMSPGKTRVNVMVVSGPSYLLAKKASIAFEVVVPLVFLHESTFVSKPDLLLSPGSSHSVRSNLPADYSLMEDETKSILILDQKVKQVISKGIAGTSIVAIKERRDQQTSLVRVTVKTPHHLELRPRFSHSSILPVGSTLDYDIILRDELGKQFDSYEKINFVTFLNRHDIINVQILKSNESDYKQVVRIKAIRPGQVILQTRVDFSSNFKFGLDEHSLSNYQYNLEDYQLIKVSNAIFPVNPVVHIGGTVQFKTTFQPVRQLYQRIWFTGDPNIARIDPDTGYTTCISVGQTNIYHDSNVFTFTTIKCTQIDSIETSECVKSSIFINETQNEVPLCEMTLKFLDSDRVKISDSPDINQNIVGHCIPKDPTLRSKFLKTESGKYVCEISTDNKKYIDHDLYYQISTITIDVSDVNKSYLKKKTTGIIVKEDFSIRGKKEIFLTPYKSSEILEVRTSVPLSIRIRDPTLVSLYELSSDPETEITRYEIKAKVKHHQFTTILTFESLKSMRTEEVLIIFREIGDDIVLPDSEDLQGYQVLWITIIIAVLSIVATYIYTLISNRENLNRSVLQFRQKTNPTLTHSTPTNRKR